MPSPTDITPSYPYPHVAPNEPVTLHEGPVTIEGGASGSGRLVLRWMPRATLYLEADLDSSHSLHAGDRLSVAVDGSTAEVLFSQVSFGHNEAGPFARVSGSISSFATGIGTGLKELGFQVVNFNDFYTRGPRPGPVFGYPPRVATVAHDGWRIDLSAVPQAKQVFDGIGETGGYTFTHIGRLQRGDGSHFTATDAESVIEALRWFLSFARGAACAFPVRWGAADDGATVWQEWSSPVVDPWKGRDTWFDEHHGNLLQDVFPGLAQYMADPDLAPPMRLALHWFQKANTRAGGMEGAIVLGLSSLDLLGALVVVERAKVMTEADYDSKKTTHKAKLVALLNVLKAPQVIPQKYTDLAAFATANGWTSAAETLTEIRHGFVHSSRKRRKVVFAAPGHALFQAWQLSLWYQELALLYLFGHEGDYRNRVTAEWIGQVEKVPWV